MYMKQIEGHIQRIKDRHKHGNLTVVIPVQESGRGKASVGVNVQN